MLAELCKQYTDLEEVQISLLERINSFIPFASSVAKQGVVFFTKTIKGIDEEGILILNHQGGIDESRKLFAPYTVISELEVPLWAKVFEKSEVLRGKQEHKLGHFLNLAVFPVVDNGGKVIGGVAFMDIDATEQGFLLAETACMSIMVPDLDHPHLYTPISYQAGLIIFDESGIILFANQAAKNMVDLLGFDRRLVGTSVYGGTLKLSFVKQTIAKRQGDEMEELYDNLVLQQRIIPIISGGKIVRSYLILQDKTLVRQSEQELLVKNSVIKEIHHRVKNNLQAIAGLLRMQARRSNSDEVKVVLFESIHRIESLSLVHDMLCYYKHDLVDLHKICHELLRLLTYSLLEPEQTIHSYYEGSTITLSSDKASYLALIINELISNAYKHGFKGRKEGTFVLQGKVLENGKIELLAIDDGSGLPPNFDYTKHKSLGMQIMKQLVENQLNGTIEFFSNVPTGCVVRICFDRGE